MSLLDWIIIGLGGLAVLIYLIISIKNQKQNPKTKKEDEDNILKE